MCFFHRLALFHCQSNIITDFKEQNAAPEKETKPKYSTGSANCVHVFSFGVS